MIGCEPPFLKTFVELQLCKQWFVIVALKIEQKMDKCLTNCCMPCRSDIALPTVACVCMCVLAVQTQTCSLESLPVPLRVPELCNLKISIDI